MDNTRTKTIEREPTLNSYVIYDGNSKETQENLEKLLTLNTEHARQDKIFRSDEEEFEAELIQNPVTSERAFSYFGLMLGSFPPGAFFIRVLAESGDFRTEEIWIFFLMLLVIVGSSVTGFFTGRLIGKIVTELEKISWQWMILALPFIGLLWGIVSGGAGGIFLFVIGAVVGAMIGGLVGGAALPAFTILHRIFRRGEIIDMRIFLPLAFGVTFVISAFILGF